MKSQAQILLIGKDEMVLHTRQLILGTFFRVETAGRISHAMGILANRHFDLIVLCYSLTDDECRKVEALIQQLAPSTKILNMSHLGRPSSCSVDGPELSSESGPYALAQKCAEMLGVELKTIGRSPRPSARRLEKLPAT